MRGEDVEQDELFSHGSLEGYVPASHPLRSSDAQSSDEWPKSAGQVTSPEARVLHGRAGQMVLLPLQTSLVSVAAVAVILPAETVIVRWRSASFYPASQTAMAPGGLPIQGGTYSRLLRMREKRKTWQFIYRYTMSEVSNQGAEIGVSTSSLQRTSSMRKRNIGIETTTVSPD